MPNIFVDHKDRWLSLAESDSDFAILFIRLWIPFNAWYCNTYPHCNQKDSEILKEMKTDNNLFRTRIIAHLGGDDKDSVNFRTFLGQLHAALQLYHIPDSSHRITFTALRYRVNPLTVSVTPNPFRGMNYKAELLSGRQVQAVIVEQRTSATKFTYSHTRYDLAHFRTNTNFTALSADRQAIMLRCFEAINPRKAEDLTTTDKKNNINCTNVLFIKDADLLSQAVIELLYRLRCILFHGEIQPSKDNLSVYEPAYYMLRILLKSLK